MTAPRRRVAQSVSHRTIPTSNRDVLRQNKSIQGGLEQLEASANKRFFNTTVAGQRMGSNGYKRGELVERWIGELSKVIDGEDWRPAIELRTDRLRRAANHIIKGVDFAIQAATGCPTYNTIPSIVYKRTAEGQIEERRTAALRPGNVLDLIKVTQERDRRLVEKEKVRPDFLKEILRYAQELLNEASRLDSILKARDRRYDRIGPITDFIQDVEGFTGKLKDTVIARLLTDAVKATETGGKYTQDSIRKLRERYLPS